PPTCDTLSHPTSPLPQITRLADRGHPDHPRVQPRAAASTRPGVTRQVVGRRPRVRADTRRALRARPLVPRLRHVAILPTARHSGARDRCTRRVSRLRRGASARARAALARATAGAVSAAAPGLAAHAAVLAALGPPPSAADPHRLADQRLDRP